MLTVAELMAQAGLEVEAGLRAASGTLLDRSVNRVAYDSRMIGAGDLFVAVRGQRHDGSEFADEAASRGAVAVVAETIAPPDFSVPWFKVADARAALAALAASAWGHPSQDLVVVGITGTNGKTTTTYLLEGVFECAGYPCGRVSSVSYRVAGRGGVCGAHDAGGAGSAGSPAAYGPAPVPGLRHGSVVACPGVAARGRHPLQRGGLHEPDPRPS